MGMPVVRTFGQAAGGRSDARRIKVLRVALVWCTVTWLQVTTTLFSDAKIAKFSYLMSSSDMWLSTLEFYATRRSFPQLQKWRRKFTVFQVCTESVSGMLFVPSQNLFGIMWSKPNMLLQVVRQLFSDLFLGYYPRLFHFNCFTRLTFTVAVINMTG